MAQALFKNEILFSFLNIYVSLMFVQAGWMKQQTYSHTTEVKFTKPNLSNWLPLT